MLDFLDEPENQTLSLRDLEENPGMVLGLREALRVTAGENRLSYLYRKIREESPGDAGLIRDGNRWRVRAGKFLEFFSRRPDYKARSIPPGSSRDEILNSDAIYFLAEAGQFFGISERRIRATRKQLQILSPGQAKKMRKNHGIFCFDGGYFIEMPAGASFVNAATR